MRLGRGQYGQVKCKEFQAFWSGAGKSEAGSSRSRRKSRRSRREEEEEEGGATCANQNENAPQAEWWENYPSVTLTRIFIIFCLDSLVSNIWFELLLS